MNIEVEMVMKVLEKRNVLHGSDEATSAVSSNNNESVM